MNQFTVGDVVKFKDKKYKTFFKIEKIEYQGRIKIRKIGESFSTYVIPNDLEKVDMFELVMKTIWEEDR